MTSLSEGDGFLETIAETKGVEDPATLAMFQDFDALHENGRQKALQSIQYFQQTPPSYWIMSKTGAKTCLLFEEMPPKQTLQHLFAFSMNFFLQSYPVDAYVFYCETWFAKGTQDQYGKTLPSERSDRLEMMFVRVATPLHSTVRMYQIERDSTGNVTDLTKNNELNIDFDDENSICYNPMMTNIYQYDFNKRPDLRPKEHPS